MVAEPARDLEQRVIPSPRELKSYLDEHVIGQDEAKVALSVAFWRHYSRLSRRVLPSESPNSHVLMAGPTGSGKTMMIKLLARKVGKPWLEVDITEYTIAGYVGEDISTIPFKLLGKANCNKDQAMQGILYLDEIDKISRQGSGGLDVARGGVQEGLLKLLEGKEVVSKDGERMDTSGILIVASGAFQGIETIIKRRARENAGIGFGKDPRKDNALDPPQLADLVAYGMDPEFLGRFSTITHTRRLSVDALYAILSNPHYTPIRDAAGDFEMAGINLDFSECGLRAIAQNALQGPTGARALAQGVTDVLTNILYHAVGSNIHGIVVSREVVLNPQDAVDQIIASGRRDPDDFSHRYDAVTVSRTDYVERLRDMGMTDSYVTAVAEISFNNGIPYEEVPALIGAINDEIREYQTGFIDRYGVHLDLKDDARVRIIQMGIQDSEGAEEIIERHLGGHFEQHEALIKNPGHPQISLYAGDFENPDGLIERVRAGRS